MTDPQDFEQLVLRYQGVVCAVAFSVLRDRARSEDVAQDAFLIAWQKLPTLSAPPAMPGWLCGIARNLAANAARRRKLRASAGDPEPAMTADLVTPTPLHALLDREADTLARQALDSLADRDREVVVLYYRGEGSITDVATTLGITETAARQRLHRGRERLRTALASVETTLRNTRPGPAFTAACIAALAARGATAHAAASATTKPVWIAALAIPGVIAVTLGGIWAVSGTSTPARPGASSVGSAARIDLDAGRPTTPVAVVHRIDDTARASLLARIQGARAVRTRSEPPVVPGVPRAPDKIYDFAGGPLAPLPPLPAPAPGPLSKATLRYAIQSIQPLLLECTTAARQPPSGTIEVVLRLAGEPELGTIVESVELHGALDGQPRALDGELTECMQETLMSIELPAMTDGGVWEVHYPFTVGPR